MKQYKKIYFFRPGALGDILIAAPLFFSIKQKYPYSKLILISEEGTRLNHVNAKMVVELIPEIEKTILYPNTSVYNKYKFFKETLDFTSNNAIVYLNYSRCSVFHVLRDYVFFKCIGFKNTFSFWNYVKNSEESRKKFIPEFQRLFNITFDLTGSNTIPNNFILNKTLIKDINKFKIFSAPFGKAKSKRWPIERYDKLYNELASKGFEIIVCGSIDEEEEFNRIGWNNKKFIKGLFGLNFKDLVDKIKDSILYLGNDTGPMHLAALLNIKCIALFSDTNRDTNWTPYGNDNHILRTYLKCGNCKSEICKFNNNKCMNDISYQNVHSTVMKNLSINE